MTIRWGIVTAGKISHDFVNAINSYPDKGDMVVAGVAARNKDRATEFAKIHKIPEVFDSYQAMANSKNIDVAYIGSLNPDHYEHSKLFLENGKHVLCEKPLCMNSKQVQSLINIAQKKKLFLMEAVWSRFAPSYIALEKDLSAGNLGDILQVEVNFGFSIANVDRLRMKELGGSAVLDLGIYVLQFAQYIFKEEPINVTVRGELNEDKVDLADTIILEYSGGRKAVLNVHTKVKLNNNATVYGTKGHITMKEPFHFPTEMVKVDGSIEKFPLHSSSLPYNFGNSSGLVYEALETARCIREGLLESPRVSHKESLIIAKLEDEVRKQVGVHFDVDDKAFP